MAQGDNFLDCKLTTDQVFRAMIYDDGNGNPVLHTDPDGTDLEPFFNCAERKNLSTEQVFRMMVLEDADGNPYLNTTTS